MPIDGFTKHLFSGLVIVFAPYRYQINFKCQKTLTTVTSDLFPVKKWCQISSQAIQKRVKNFKDIVSAVLNPFPDTSGSFPVKILTNFSLSKWENMTR